MESGATHGPGPSGRIELQAWRFTAIRCMLVTMPQRKTILIIDDDDDLREILREQLQHPAEFVALGAATATEGLRLAAEKRPDLVILDMNMPGWGGPQTLPKLREILPQVPILLSTGRADQRAIDLARSHAGVTILAKPFSFRELQGAITALLPGA